MKSVFNQEHVSDLKNRIEQLTAKTEPDWGKMSVGQMCEHCARALDVNAGIVEEEKPNLLIKLFSPLLKMFVLNDKPYRKNSPTTPQFKVQQPINFGTGKQRLLESLTYFSKPENKEKIVNTKSKVFGQLTEDEKGWAQYKHIDYHLTQFGV